MIRIGYDHAAKDALVSACCSEHGVSRVVVLCPRRFRTVYAVEHEHVDWPEIIMYRTFYRLLQAIDKGTLVVVDECLRTQDRNDLTYNCIRHFLGQAGHVIVFQHLPMIDTFADFMVLFDFDTRSEWKRSAWRPEFRRLVDVEVECLPPTFLPVDVPVADKTRDEYSRRKRELIDGIGLRDPHTIPRNLYQVGGRDKLAHVVPSLRYVGRNDRFKRPNLETYPSVSTPGERVVFELPHRFLDFCDFLSVSRQRTTCVLTADLKVDRWYLQRYMDWSGRLADACAALQ